MRRPLKSRGACPLPVANIADFQRTSRFSRVGAVAMYNRVEAVFLELVEQHGKKVLYADEISSPCRVLQGIIQEYAGWELSWRAGHGEDDRHIIGDQMGDVVQEGGMKSGFLGPDDGQPDSRPFLVVRR